MLFSDLYASVAEVEKPHVRIEYLRAQVNARHKKIGRVDVIRVEYPRPTFSAYYRLADGDRSSAYEEDFTVAEIVYCSSLDKDEATRRYALTKELMHVFDTDDQMASSRERFIKLMREVQNRPLPQHESAMYQSELDTRWMAALVLCPRHLRNAYKQLVDDKHLVLSEVADAFRIPEWVAYSIIDDYYDVAHGALIDATNGHG